MVGKAIDLISKSGSDHGKIGLNLVKYLVTIVLSAVLYSFLFGQFEIIPIDDYPAIINFILKGGFIQPLLIFSFTWFFFYFILDFFIIRYAIKIGDLIVYIFRHIQKNGLKGQPKFVRQFYKKIGKILLEINLFQSHGEEWLTGHTFPKFQKFIKEIQDGKDEIDIDFFVKLFIVILQIILLLWMSESWNNFQTWIFSSITTLILVIFSTFLFIFIGMAVTLRIYATPIYKEMELMTKSSEDYLKKLNEEVVKEKADAELVTKEI